MKTVNVAASKGGDLSKTVAPLSRVLPSVYCGVAVEHDDYVCFGNCDGCNGYDDYCRGAEYVNLRIESVDLLNVLKNLFGCRNTSDVPDALFKEAVALGMDEIASYGVHTRPDYYGEEAYVTVNESVFDALTDWYFSRPNARDRDGVLEYCRSKGIDTSGLAPLDALRVQLDTENRGAGSVLVEGVTDISYVGNVYFSDITIPNKRHYEYVKPRTLTTDGIAEKVAGVLVRDESRDILVDGYHRMKELRAQNKRVGRYIVLR
jgi:hypothetical protein